MGKISRLLYQEGYTIKGVQRLLREGALKSSGRPVAANLGVTETLPLGFLEFTENDPAEELLEDEPEPPPRRRRAAPTAPLEQGDQALLREVLRELRALRALLPPRR